MTRSTINAAYDRLDRARTEYVDLHSNGFRKETWLASGDYESEGIAIGRMALDVAPEEREDFIADEVAKYDRDLRELMTYAAEYELACNGEGV